MRAASTFWYSRRRCGRPGSGWRASIKTSAPTTRSLGGSADTTPTRTRSSASSNKANSDTSGGFRDTQITLSHTHVFGPTLVNDLRVGFVQEHNYTIASSAPSPELGIKNVLLYEFPQITVQNAAMIPLGSSASNGDRDRSYVFSEALNLVKGRHNLKIGGDYRRQMWNNYSPVNFRQLHVLRCVHKSARRTRARDPGWRTCCWAIPPPRRSASTTIRIAGTSTRAGMYVQDDFKITAKLT